MVEEFNMDRQENEESDQNQETDSAPQENAKTFAWRNILAFWFLGLCNNFGYVVMLSAAHDILKQESHQGNSTVPRSGFNLSNQYDCNPISTGAILLADILPALTVKMTAPYFIQSIHYSIKVAAVVLFGAASFLIVAFSHTVEVSVLGVACASIASGLGELTFLGLTSFYHRSSVSAWSSGTGGAGVGGALSYAGLLQIGVSARNSLLIMLIVPFTLSISFWLVLEKRWAKAVAGSSSPEADRAPLLAESDGRPPPARQSGPNLSLTQKFQLVKPLVCKYMAPLFLVYVAEYFINQGLFELIFFRNIWLSHSEQYRWFQVIYQIGVFISRSSVSIVQIHALWLLAFFQFVNVGLFLLEVLHPFLPSIWIVFAMILWEGLLGGAAYVNTFYKMSQEIAEEHREFSLGVTSQADSCGIAVAGAIAIPVHNVLCSL
ncbi:battenin-like [Branchiostoma lanceolatum]|uniref:battenin-like n=1 Tax=Branchiostoma lanceolatum TaxID=7740 RepID=UPI0034524509